jgi:sugar lactone lactonase YvrE
MMTSARPNSLKITGISPAAALPGGELLLHWSGGEGRSFVRPEVRFPNGTGHLISATPEMIVVQVPENAVSGEVSIVQNGRESNGVHCEIGVLVASNLHPVANPALDLEGNLYTTLSGRRGEKVPQSLFRITPSGVLHPLETDIMNPTGIAFNSQGEMFVSSRHDGNIYKVSASGEKSAYAKGMGVATGMAFDYEDNLYVGDRTGTVFKIDRKREIFVFATLEPSVAAYHLVFDEMQNLFVSGPTTSSYDQVHRVGPDGNVTTYLAGLGRPQGMAFDIEGNLYVAASWTGRRGIVRISPERKAELFVSGHNLLGLAFAYHRGIFLVTGNSLYKLSSEVMGKPLP